MKLVVTEYVSFDGVMEDPIWIGPYIDDDFLKFKFDELMRADALLLGRRTYDYFLPVWASGEPMEDAPGQEGFAARVEQLPKYVVSTTLSAPRWNNSRILHDDIVEHVRQLRQQSGQDLLVTGSAGLLPLLMEHQIVDEYRVLLFPTIVGQGKHLFAPGQAAALDLVSVARFQSGVVALVYRPDPADTRA